MGKGSKVIIVNKKKFEETKERIRLDGASKLHVLSDFDKTITRGLTSDGKKANTVISQFRSDPKYLGQAYFDEAHKLFDIYHPIEVDPNVLFKEKNAKMHEWWMRHFKLLAKSGLSLAVIGHVVSERPLEFREGSLEFLTMLESAGIPLILMSAAPGDMLIEYLRASNLLLPNVYVIANLYNFDSKGKALDIREPIVHSMNKAEIVLEGHPVYKKVKTRRNVILLGDGLEDPGMIEGFDYDNLIKIGFMNEDPKENLAHYKKAYDVVITGDGNMDFVNDLVKEVLG